MRLLKAPFGILPSRAHLSARAGEAGMTHKPRRVDLNPDNFIAGIAGQLTLTELGLYWLVCLLIYSHGGPIPYDEEHWRSLVRGTHWRTVKAASRRLQELGKITSSDGQAMAKGCSGPLQEAFKRVSRAIENGSKGGRPSSKNKDLGKAKGLRAEKLARARARLNPLPLPLPPPLSEEISSLRSDSAQPKVNGHKVTKGTRWPSEQIVPEAWVQEIGMQRAQRGLAAIDVGLEATIFANYWSSKSGAAATKVDWHKTWINWGLKAEPRRGSPIAAPMAVARDPTVEKLAALADEETANLKRMGVI